MTDEIDTAEIRAALRDPGDQSLIGTCIRLCDALDAARAERMHHDEGTMQKVWDALRRAGLDDTAMWSCVNDMQNAGVYFREAPRPTATCGTNLTAQPAHECPLCRPDRNWGPGPTWEDRLD